jgi:hypothetical protein
MAMSRRIAVALAIAVILAAVAVPPVIEDNLEPGFCSADCPVQHAGHGAAITAPPLAGAAGRTPVVATTETLGVGVYLGAPSSPDAPRAPPAA